MSVLVAIARTAARVGVRALRALAVFAWLAVAVAMPARAQGVEVQELVALRDAEGVSLDYVVRVTLPRPVEEALQRGVPLYFNAEARLYRPRWYWRDERVARAASSWRLSYQPLTSSWRVSQGGLHQSHPSLSAALASMSRRARWPIADAGELDADEDYYLEFSWRLDPSQLPRPMQIGIGGADWALGVERTLSLK